VTPAEENQLDATEIFLQTQGRSGPSPSVLRLRSGQALAFPQIHPGQGGSEVLDLIKRDRPDVELVALTERNRDA